MKIELARSMHKTRKIIYKQEVIFKKHHALITGNHDIDLQANRLMAIELFLLKLFIELL